MWTFRIAHGLFEMLQPSFNEYYMGFNYTEQDKMCEVIASQPSLLQMISRFGIQLGVGERTVKEVCEASQVDTNTFLAVANVMKEGPSVAPFYVDKVHMQGQRGGDIHHRA